MGQQLYIMNELHQAKLTGLTTYCEANTQVKSTKIGILKRFCFEIFTDLKITIS